MSSLGTFPEAAYLLDCEPGTAEPIVVASDGTEFSDPAIESALQLSQQSGSCVFVVAVHQITPPPVYEFAMVAALPALIEAEEGRREALRRQVEEQVRRIVGSDMTGWQIIVREGEPATELSRITTEVRARLLVMGVKHRKFSDRVFGRELALRLVQDCRTPVLIVPLGFAHAPRKVLIATDFSPSSIEAGRAALDLFDSIEQVTLIHVTPSSLPPAHFDGTWQEWLDEDTTRGFEWAKAEFALPDTVKVETVTREGHAARVIADVARDRGVDVIVTSSRGAGLINRLLVGSTARGVVRAADCAVLIVRPQAQTNVPYPLLEPDREPVPHNEFADALANFSKRNLGRRASIEVDDPDVGAQTQERNYHFHGASWDPKCSQVEIMVGDATGTQRHLTRNIADVRSIHILPDANGKDWILRVAHGNGQTLLTLQR